MNALSHYLANVLDALAKATSEVEPFEKITKFITRDIQIVELVKGSVSPAFASLAVVLKEATEIFESIRCFGAIRTLVCPNDKGVYFLQDPKNSWQKCLDRIFLAAHTCLKTIGALDRYKFIQLGQVAKCAIGKLPVFKLVTDGFIIASSFFAGWDAAIIQMPKAQKNLSLTNNKIEKWEYRATVAALVRVGEMTEINEILEKSSLVISEKNLKLSENIKVITELEKEALVYKDILQQIDNETINMPSKGYFGRKQTPEDLRKIYQDKAKETAQKITVLMATQERLNKRISTCNDRITKINSREYKELSQDLVKKDISHKIELWEVRKENTQIEITKNWLRIANAIAKIAVVTLALVLTGLNFWALPYLMTLLVLGNIADTIGFTKIMYEDFRKSKPEPVSSH